ncbi:hypothetical protein Q4577_01410 [Marinovum sp. 2_MG-2023]|uniref:hypothetical protein n=1 Tax=unclassified Marinovum TaxID=2647166 RepID=UPI0026E3661C|nr:MULTISPECIES: hypothetical protein [unclassified Marinovum]MDO6728655.1 hypothetical protein [Marinovum sp. 2_MG-2023]MDO6777929.1 hypothetical protein [Marinovum sp. 1_MG-2023]
MRPIVTLSLVFSVLSAPLLAQTGERREGDQSLAASALDLRLRGKIIEFYDGGQAEYYADGRYTYTYSGEGGTGYGYYKVTGDSTICIEFVNGFNRCDTYITDAQDRLVVITEKGDRFPVRN